MVKINKKKDKFWNDIMDSQDKLELEGRIACQTLIELAVLKAAYHCPDKKGWESFLKEELEKNIKFLKEKNNGNK